MVLPCVPATPIEFAIARRIDVFEGGAQGEHKLFRGLLPVETLSAHWLAHPAFARAVAHHLQLGEGAPDNRQPAAAGRR